MQRLLSHVKDIKLLEIHLKQHPSICGVGHHTRGHEYTSILRDPSAK